MERWARHREPLFEAYNVPPMDEQRRRGFFERFAEGDTISLAGEAQGRLVAHIVLRQGGQAAGTADLGVSMDPAWMGRGIGTELLRLTLRAAGARYGLRWVELDVASYNERALRAYVKAGFSETGRRWVSYETPLDLQALAADPSHEWLREHVRIDSGYMISLVHMRAPTKEV